MRTLPVLLGIFVSSCQISPSSASLVKDETILEDAETIVVDLRLRSSGEITECELVDGWFEDEDATCAFQSRYEVKDADLPWALSANGFRIRLDRQGALSISYTAGDFDGSAKADLTLPRRDGKILFGDDPYVLKLTGGEHASGSWNADGRVSVGLK